MADERRQFKRLHAPVFCRPIGRAMSASQEVDPLDVQDISLGGIRVYTDDKHSVGDHLELELLLPDGEGMSLDTAVVWVEKLPNADPAKFEVGLKFTDIKKSDLERLGAVLKEE